LQKALEDELDEDVTVLVKGSRFMKMERVVQFCTGDVKEEGTKGQGEGRREKGSCALNPLTHASQDGRNQ